MRRFYFLSTLLLLTLFIVSLLVGAADIPAADVFRILFSSMSSSSLSDSATFIVLQSRLPQALTAILCGSALAVSGLLLQTAFRNPLAGPSVFGINSGASLGVALVMLLPTSALSFPLLGLPLQGGGGLLSSLLAAFIGAMVVMGIILACATIVRNSIMLLIVGIMVGYLASSAISLLNFFATEEGVQSYMVWGLGNFGGVTLQQMPLFAAITVVGLFASLLLIKPLNALLLGERYAENLGVNTRRLRYWLLAITGLLTAIATAFCGPVAFIGLAVPHIARMLLGTENHHQLLPATILFGAIVALLCNIITVLPGSHGIIPLNAVTPFIGAPVIIYVILKK